MVERLQSGYADGFYGNAMKAIIIGACGVHQIMMEFDDFWLFNVTMPLTSIKIIYYADGGEVHLANLKFEAA